MSEPSVSYIAIGVVAALATGLVMLFFRLWGWLAERKLQNDDDTRIKTVRLEERFAHAHTHGPQGHDRELVMAITGLTEKLADLTDRVVQAQSESARSVSSFAAELAGMNARLTESLRISERRLDKIEEAAREHVTHRDLTLSIEAAARAAASPVRTSHPPHTLGG